MKPKHGKMKILLIMLLTLYFSIGAAIAANAPKTVLSFVTKSDKTTFPAAASTIIKVTDASGQVATYTGTNTTIIAYDDSAGLINIAMGNFTTQWKANDSLKIEVTSGTAGTKTFEFGDTTATLDDASMQTLTPFTLTASKRNMTKTAGDAQSQVFSTVLKTKLEVTVVDDLGDPVKGVTPTAKGDGTITAFTTTDSTGKSTATWTLGATIGTQKMTVSLAGYPDAVFTATATPGPLASYAITDTGFNVKAGIQNTITVTAKDASGNTITNYTGKVSFTSTDTAAVLPSDYTFVSGDKGVKIFNVTLKTAGAQTITVTTGSIAGKMTKTIVPAAASKINLTTSATTIASNGVGTAVLTATMQDPFNNIVTAESGSVTYTVTGTDTSNADWTTKTATLTKGVATATLTTKGTVGGTGSVTVSVVAGKDSLTSAKVTLTIINFSVTPAATSNAKIGDKINLTVEGAAGTVTWKVTGDAGVGTLGSFTGTNKEKAVFTVAKAGNATITVTEGSKKSTATVAAHNKVAIADKPTTTKTVTDSVTYSATGGDGTFTWTVTGPVSVTGYTGKAPFTFKAPTTGAFAGTYTITVADSVNTNSDTFTVYVPLTIDPDATHFVLSAKGGSQTFTVTGAAASTPYTTTIDSLDDNLADKIVPGKFSAAFTALPSFDPQAYTITTDTGTKQYTFDFEAKGHKALPQIVFDVVPVKSFTGIMTDSDGKALTGAIITITSPAGSAGMTTTSAKVTGDFTFANLPVPAKAKYQFKAEKAGYITTTFDSSMLKDDGLTKIKMKSSKASISGQVTNPGGVMCSMTLFDKNGEVSGSAGSADSDTLGNFRFEFETAPAVPASYTIKSSRPGFSGFTSITATSLDYTGVSFALTALATPKDNTPTGIEPTGNKGVIDASAGGIVDMTGDAGLQSDVKKAFGSNEIKLVIKPKADGDVVRTALPETASYTPTSTSPQEAVKWEIEGLGDGCAIIPVPFKLSDADKIKAGSLIAWYAHGNPPYTWKPAEVVGEPDYIGDGINGVINVRICGWTSNVVGIAPPPSSTTSSSGSSDSGGCFISSLSGSGTSGNMIAWMSILALLAIGIIFTFNRKRKTN